MNADVLTTRVADDIAVVTLGSARRIYFDEEMGDALTEALDGFAGDPNVRVVIVTGGAPEDRVRLSAFQHCRRHHFRRAPGTARANECQPEPTGRRIRKRETPSSTL